MQKAKIKGQGYRAKFKIILGFGAILALLAVVGYLRAMPSQNSVDGPRIQVEPTTFDFGRVETGRVVEHRFAVENIGSKVLEITRVSTSCGCTSAEVDKEKLAPGEKAELLVTYDSGLMKHEKGKIERFVYIRSNDPLNPQTEVTIYAWVE